MLVQQSADVGDMIPIHILRVNPKHLFISGIVTAPLTDLLQVLQKFPVILVSQVKLFHFFTPYTRCCFSSRQSPAFSEEPETAGSHRKIRLI